MDETSQTIALVCFTIMSGVSYLPKMKKKINGKNQTKFNFKNVNIDDENSIT